MKTKELKNGIRNICKKVGEQNIKSECPGFFYKIPIPKQLNNTKNILIEKALI